jgi:broad specificity phosphatase PhoE
MRSAFPAPNALAAHAGLGLGLLVGLAVGCAEARLPDPKLAAAHYAEAARAGDSERIYALLSSEAQRDYGRQGARRLVEQAKAELSRQGAALLSPESRVQASAEIRFEDGESALFDLEDGAFHLRSLGTVPSRPRSPSEALGDFRRALARRSYPALLGVLSAETRQALEGDLKSLVEGLENPETLDVKVSGDNAVVRVPGGHQVKLRREAGVWHVQDFD